MLCFMIIVSTLPDLSQTFASYNPLDNIDGISIKCNSILNEAKIVDGVIDYPFIVKVDGWDDLIEEYRKNIRLVEASATISSSESVLLLSVNDHMTGSNNMYTYDISGNDTDIALHSNAKIETKTIKDGLAAVYLKVRVILECNGTQKTFTATQELQLKGKESNNYPKIFFKKQHKDPAIDYNYQTLEPGRINEESYVRPRTRGFI